MVTDAGWTAKIEPQLNVFPNPSSNIINVTGNLTKQWKIYDLLGKIVFDEDVLDDHLNIEILTSGVYFLNVDNQWVKFIKK
jgi:hypothetical protein